MSFQSPRVFGIPEAVYFISRMLSGLFLIGSCRCHASEADQAMYKQSLDALELEFIHWYH